MTQRSLSISPQTRGKVPLEAMASEERATRIELAAAYRYAHWRGWTDLIFTHISARVPGPHEHFLINPFGLAFDEVRASNLVKIDMGGNVIGASDHGVNTGGFVIHSAVHGARPDCKCVMHLHTESGTALSASAEGLRPLTQHAMRFYNRLGYHAYEGLALNESEKVRLVDDLGNHNAMILRNHGLLTAGATVAAALTLMYYLDCACAAQLRAVAGSVSVCEPTAEIAEATALQFESDPVPVGEREWPAILRLMDRLDPAYRQ